MTTELIGYLLNYGLAGAIFIVFIIYINHKEKQHSIEREAWMNQSNKHVDRFSRVIEESTKALTVLHGDFKSLKEGQERIESKVA